MLSENIQLIARCISSAHNAVHLDTCEQMIVDRIEFYQDLRSAETLRKLILIRQCELLIHQYPIYE
jgi:hypothetical protein